MLFKFLATTAQESMRVNVRILHERLRRTLLIVHTKSLVASVLYVKMKSIWELKRKFPAPPQWQTVIAMIRTVRKSQLPTIAPNTVPSMKSIESRYRSFDRFNVIILAAHGTNTAPSVLD
ncbi:MAG: hypothetical protein F4053_16480 [Proteobacteria bacterium]|nr:hypothetical protein [Pseudomonadota bacterium]